MEWIPFLTLLAQVVIIVGGGLLWRNLLQPYFNEKAKNLATKQDIGEITSQIEEIRAQHAIEVESVKGEIQKLVSEHDTRFAYLHKRRGEVIDQLYKLNVKMMRPLYSSATTVKMNIQRSEEEERAEGLRLIPLFVKYYYENHLYLDEDLCKLIDDLLAALTRILNELGQASQLFPLSLYDIEVAKMQSEFYNKVRERINNDLPGINALIEKKMRVILGSTEAK